MVPTECPLCLGAGEIEMCEQCGDLVDFCEDESHTIGYYNDGCGDCGGSGEAADEEEVDDD